VLGLTPPREITAHDRSLVRTGWTQLRLSAETCSEEERPIELLGVPWRAAIERTQEIMERFHKEFCEKEAERARQNKKVPDIYSSGGRVPEREPFLLPQNVQKIEREEVA
jgi:hypothetical protein